MLRWLFGEENVAAMRAAPSPVTYPSGAHRLVSLVRALVERKDCNRIHIKKSGLSVTLER